MPKLKEKLLNFYFRRPLFCDSIFFSSLVLINELAISKYKEIIVLNRNTLNNLLNELVSSSISIAGFIIAALTIILTIKDNVNAKEKNSVNSGLKLLLTSKHYKSILDVFYNTSFIFVSTFFYFSLIEIFDGSLSDKVEMYLILFGLIVTTLGTFRCLYILKSILYLQIKDSSN